MQWYKARIEKRPGRTLRSKRAYADYITWCTSNASAPVNWTEFGNTMKTELKVEKDSTNNRVRYIGIDLASDLPLVTREELAKFDTAPTLH